MILDADAAALLPTNEDVFLQHQVSDVLEPDRNDGARKSQFLADPIYHDTLRHGPDDLPFPTPLPHEMQSQQRQNLMRIDVVPFLVHGTQAIGISIGSQANSG